MMKPLSRILMTSVAVALAVPLLSAALGCSDCEDFCQQGYDECDSNGITADPQRCQVELNRCLEGCDAEPTDWEELSSALY